MTTTALENTSNVPTKSIDDVIEEIGIGKFQRKLLVIAGMGWAADAMEVAIIAFAIRAIGAQWGLTGEQRTILTGVIFLGMLLGAIFWGRSSDRIGRKFGFQATIAIDSIFGLLSAFSPSYIFLLVTRFITGFGIGGTLPIDYSIFAEYLPREKRGRWLVFLEGFWAIGILVLAILAWVIIPNIPNNNLNWRILLAVSALPGLIIVLIRRHVPESPRYLLAAGREEEARQVLLHVAEQNGVNVQIGQLRDEATENRGTLKTLLQPAFRKRTIMLWIAWFTIAFGYYGTLIWLPSIFAALGFETLPVYQNQVVLALAQIPGYISAAVLVEVWGRKGTLAVYLAASAVFTYLFAVIGGTTGPVVASAALMTFFTLGAWGVLYAYTPELYPTEIRSTGMGTASAVARVAAFIAPLIGGYIFTTVEPGGLVIALTLFAIMFTIGAAAVLILGPETKGIALDEVSSGQAAEDPRPAAEGAK